MQGGHTVRRGPAPGMPNLPPGMSQALLSLCISACSSKSLVLNVLSICLAVSDPLRVGLVFLPLCPILLLDTVWAEIS